MLIRTLYAKLVVALVIILAVMSIVYVGITVWTSQLHNEEVTQALQHDLAKHIVKHYDLCENPETGGTECKPNSGEIKKLFEHLMFVNPIIECYLIDTSGRLLDYSVPDESIIQRQAVDIAPIRSFIEGADHFPLTGDDPRSLTAEKIFSAAPIGDPADPAGYLYVILGSQEHASVAQMLRGSYILKLAGWIALASLLFAALAGVGLFNWLTRRLRRLATTVDAFRRSDFAESPRLGDYDSERGDEIDSLGAAFQRMATRIRDQFERLRGVDRMRRELIANVSHDLRTPLATLRGYLETLQLKEGTLSDEERRAYLDIALRHSERLGTLITELFELSKLDSYEGELQREPFALAELVHDVLQEFQLQANEKSVTLRPNLRGQLPFVIANVGLIERVLQNLIDNALRHTEEGGTVTVELTPEPSGKVTVQVRDDGCGIDEADLPHVFERFYRRDRTTEQSSNGAGLGLAIAKRALELHGSDIEVRSQLGVGTDFSFHLQAHS